MLTERRMSMQGKGSGFNHMKTINRREEKMLEKRERLIRAAIQVFASKGYPQRTIADISRRAKVSYGLAYTYFKNKEDILFTIFSERWQRFIDYLEKVQHEEGLPVDAGHRRGRPGPRSHRSFIEFPDSHPRPPRRGFADSGRVDSRLYPRFSLEHCRRLRLHPKHVVQPAGKRKRENPPFSRS